MYVYICMCVYVVMYVCTYVYLKRGICGYLIIKQKKKDTKRNIRFDNTELQDIGSCRPSSQYQCNINIEKTSFPSKNCIRQRIGCSSALVVVWTRTHKDRASGWSEMFARSYSIWGIYAKSLCRILARSTLFAFDCMGQHGPSLDGTLCSSCCLFLALEENKLWAYISLS